MTRIELHWFIHYYYYYTLIAIYIYIYIQISVIWKEKMVINTDLTADFEQEIFWKFYILPIWLLSWFTLHQLHPSSYHLPLPQAISLSSSLTLSPVILLSPLSNPTSRHLDDIRTCMTCILFAWDLLDCPTCLHIIYVYPLK